MVKLVNRAKMTTSTTGTGTITLGSASDGYQSFADAGVSNSDTVRYTIEDGNAWEIGTGTYTASGSTLSLSRSVSESSSSGSAINLSGSAEVFITATAADILSGATTYANVAALPSTGNTAGDLAYVTTGSNSKPSLYIWNGYGWYKIDDVNTTPTMNDLGGSLTISQNSNSTITITASDVDENTTLQYKYEVTTGSLPSGTTITETDGTTAIAANTYVNGNQFRINSGSTNGNYTLTFTVTDGINTSSDTKEVTMGQTWTLLKTIGPITPSVDTTRDTLAYGSDETWSSVEKRYWKFEIHKTRTDNGLQFGEFKMKASGGGYNSWHSNATVAAYRTNTGASVAWTGNEGVDKGFDNNNTGNKAYKSLTGTGSGDFNGTNSAANVTIIVDNTTEMTTTGFNYYTANDADGRDPIEIKIYYSDSSADFD